LEVSDFRREDLKARAPMAIPKIKGKANHNAMDMEILQKIKRTATGSVFWRINKAKSTTEIRM